MIDSIPILVNVDIKIKIFKIQFNLNHINNRLLSGCRPIGTILKVRGATAHLDSPK
jgi:hypothetical protein